MSRCLNLTKSGEYALSALSQLAVAAQPAAPLPVADLARARGIPPSFLAKILSRCVKAGLIEAKKGPEGGVRLGRPAEQITLLEIIEACEGRYSRDFCALDSARRCEGTACVNYCALRRQEEELRQGLARATLAEMARSLTARA